MKYNLMTDMPERLMGVWLEKVKKKMLKWGDNLNGHQSLPVIPVTPPKKDILMVELSQHVPRLPLRRSAKAASPFPLVSCCEPCVAIRPSSHSKVSFASRAPSTRRSKS